MFFRKKYSSLEILKGNFKSGKLFDDNSSLTDERFEVLFITKLASSCYRAFISLANLFSSQEFKDKLKECNTDLKVLFSRMVRCYNPYRARYEFTKIRSLDRRFRISGRKPNLFGLNLTLSLFIRKLWLCFILVLSYFILPIVFLLLPLFAVMLYAYKFISIIIGNYNHLKNTLGYFSDQLGSRRCTVLLNIKRGIRLKNYLHTVSHEHIHILQNDYVIKNEGLKELSCYPPPDLSMVIDDNRFIKPLKYLMERSELEVRLHELVCAFYAEHNTLPTNREEFMSMVASSPMISENFDSYIEIKRFENIFMENDKTNLEFYMIFRSIEKSKHLRFINEVLYRLYGNLLNYYRMDELSKKVSEQQLVGPTMYEQIYQRKPTSGLGKQASGLEEV